MANWLLSSLPAFLVGLFFFWRGARKKGLPEEQVLDLVVLVALFSLLGARVAFVLENWPEFSGNLIRSVLLLKYPGWSFSGALLAGTFTIVWFARTRKWSVLSVLDLFALPLLAGAMTAMAICSLANCLGARGTSGLVGLAVLASGAVLLAVLQRRFASNVYLVKLRRKEGLVFLAALLFLALATFPIAKQNLSPLYSSGKLVLVGGLVLVVIYYWEALLMLSFPPSILSKIKTYLEGKLAEAEHRLAQLRREDPASNKGRLLEVRSDDDEATDEAQHERIQALLQQLNRTIIDLRKALAKIKVGSYGICENCGRMIDTDRLAANPSAHFCLDCERRKEKKK